MPRELAHEDRDVEMSAETAQVPRTVLVRCTAQSRDVRLKVERRAVHVPNADGTASGPERMDHPGWYGGGLACSQRVPVAPDQDVQRTLEDLLLLVQARMHVGVRGPAVRRQLPLHLQQLTARVRARARDSVDRAVRPYERSVSRQ